MAVTGYDTIGPYKQGVWLVADNNGNGWLFDRQHLPKQGQGYKYFWLGTNQSAAAQQLDDNAYKLGVKIGFVDTPSSQLVGEALTGRPTPLTVDATRADAVNKLKSAAVISATGLGLGSAAASAASSDAGLAAAAAGAGSADAGLAAGGLAAGGLGADAALGGLAAAVGAGISGVFNQAIKDAKYGAVLVVVLFAGAYLFVAGGRSTARSVSGQT